MSRFCLRYQAIDVSLGAGELVVGRGPECGLVLDDALVSRRHAAFREQDDTLDVEDLGSRNGVLVNDARITAATRLHHGDRVQIGAHQLVVKDVLYVRPQPGTAELARCPSCGQFGPTSDASCKHCGNAPAHEAPAGAQPMAAPSTPRSASSLAVLSQLADKALSLGRADEAERVLSTVLGNILQTAKSSPEKSDNDAARDTVAAAARYALRLADVLHKAAWLDYAFELYTAANHRMPAELVDELYRVTSQEHYGNTRPLHAYLAQARTSAVAWGPTERFLLQRLEGLARRIAGG